MTEDTIVKTSAESEAALAQEKHEEFRSTIKELVQHIADAAKREKPARNIRFHEAPIGSRVFCNYIAKNPKTRIVVSEDVYYDPSMFWDAPPGALYAVLWHEFGHGQERHQRIERDDDKYFEPDLKVHGQGQVHELRNVKMDMILDANNLGERPGLALPYRALYEDSFPRKLESNPQGGLEQFAEQIGLSEGARATAQALDASERRPRWFLLALKHEAYWHNEDERVELPEDERASNPYVALDPSLTERFESVRVPVRRIGNKRIPTAVRSQEFNHQVAPVYLSMLTRRREEMVETLQNVLDEGRADLSQAGELEGAILLGAKHMKDAQRETYEQAAAILEEQAKAVEQDAQARIDVLKKEISELEIKATELEKNGADMEAQVKEAGEVDSTIARTKLCEAEEMHESAKGYLESASHKEKEISELRTEPQKIAARMRQAAEKYRAALESFEDSNQPTENPIKLEPPKDAQEAVVRILEALDKLRQAQPKKNQADQQETESPSDQNDGDEDGQGDDKEGEGEGEKEGQRKMKSDKNGKGKDKSQGQGVSEGKGVGKNGKREKSPKTPVTNQKPKADGGGGWMSVDRSVRSKSLDDLERWGISPADDREYRRVRDLLDEDALNELVNGLVLAFAEDRQRIILSDLPHGSLPTARKTEALRRRYAGEQLPAVREVRKTIDRFMGVDIIVSNDHSGSMQYNRREDAAKAANMSIASACLRVNTEIARRMRRMGLSDREIAAAPPLRYLGLLFSNDVLRMNTRGWETPLIGAQTNMDDRDLDEESFIVQMFGAYQRMWMGDNNDELSAAHALHQAYVRQFKNVQAPEERVKVIYFVTDGGCDQWQMSALLRFLHGKSEEFPEWIKRLLDVIEPGCSTKVEERIRKYRDQLFAVGIGIGGESEFTYVYNEGRIPNESDTRVYEENDVMMVRDDDLREMPKKILRLTSAKFHSPRFKSLRSKFMRRPAGKLAKIKVSA